MSERKFTPGPWHVTPHNAGGGLLHRGNGEYHMQPSLQIVPLADANLIAAAPDLYAVCEMVAHLDAGEIGEGMLRQIVELARYTLLRAEGGNDEQD